jgi:membrane-bound ClpP family serine protease
MSEEGTSFWATLAEKLIGLTLIILSIVLFYFTATSTATLNPFTGIFAFLGVAVLIGGAFLLVTKPPE